MLLITLTKHLIYKNLLISGSKPTSTVAIVGLLLCWRINMHSNKNGGTALKSEYLYFRIWVKNLLGCLPKKQNLFFKRRTERNVLGVVNLWIMFQDEQLSIHTHIRTYCIDTVKRWICFYHTDLAFVKVSNIKFQRIKYQASQNIFITNFKL